MDERPGTLPVDPDTAELWWFDVAIRGGLAASVGVGRVPGRDRAWYWAVVAGAGRDPVVVIDDEVSLPRGPASLELRAPGLWADHWCGEPGQHWGVANEAFGVALGDPWESWGQGRGDPTPLGLDLEWETRPDGLVVEASAADGQGVRLGDCDVHGEVLVGDERWWVEGPGSRGYATGPLPQWPPGWLVGWWRTDAGEFAHHLGAGPEAVVGAGSWEAPGPTQVSVPLGDAGDVAARVVAPVPLLGGGGRLVAAVVEAPDGRGGGAPGWVYVRPAAATAP